MKAQIWLAAIPLVAFCRCAKPESQPKAAREAAQLELQKVLREPSENTHPSSFEAGKEEESEHGRNRVMSASSDTAQVRIPISDLKNLVAEINYSHNPSSRPEPVLEKVLSTKFEAYKILKSEEPPAIDNYVMSRRGPQDRLSQYVRHGYFAVQDTLRLNDSNEMLVVLYGVGGFEFIPYVFAVFKIVGDELLLQGLLDELMGASIGSLKIEEVIAVSEEAYLLRGITRGGDAGDVWAEFWFSYWQRPFRLKKLFSKSYEYYSEQRQKKFDLSFDRMNLTAEVFVNERQVLGPHDGRVQYSAWSIVEQDTVDLKALIEREQQ